jgi:hypothetical protein
LASDGNALVIMCERDEEPRPNEATHWKIIMAWALCKVMNMQYWFVHKQSKMNQNENENTHISQYQGE